jgi:large subunit ribosomal protein L15
MELHTLRPAEGSTKKRKRIGRGQGSGRGGTSTRGHKGQKSRSGYKSKRNFEGGQMPLQMRLPKRGFNSPNRIEYTTINLDELERFAEKYKVEKIDLDCLVKNRFVRKNNVVKVLGRGALTRKLEVTAHAFSQSAIEAIKSQGGSTHTI